MTKVKGIRIALVLLWLMTASSAFTQAADYQPENYRKTMIQLLGATFDSARGPQADLGIFEAIAASGDALYIAPLIDIAYFARNEAANRAVIAALKVLTGAQMDWRGYFEWAGKHDIALPPAYDEFKGQLLAAFVDPEFTRFFAPGVLESANINLVEAVWGGVTVDGIPSLVNARQISPQAADTEGYEYEDFCRDFDCSYPAPDELVFGLSLGGDSRAYPLRLLNWHEMFNDVIGQTPMYDAPNGEAVCQFRAPNAFEALARSGQDWVLVAGTSAACPRSGWLKMDTDEDAIEWHGDADAWKELPDIGADEEAPETGLVEQTGQTGQMGQVRGRPVMLAYCTLCGAGVLYDARIADVTYRNLDGELVQLGETALEFGSTGLLMRSNKLMYDRATDTVWNAITGTPAFGPLAASDIALDLLPVVVTDWASWLERHPDTSVLSMDTGFLRNYSNGAAYSDYFNSADLMFPSWQQDTDLLENKDMVFALRLQGQAKAYPLETIIPERVINDRLGQTDLVIVADASPERDFFEPGGAAVRAYESAGRQFQAGADQSTLRSADGMVWHIREQALIAQDGAQLARIGGHLAFWFGWFGFYPDTLLYGVD